MKKRILAWLVLGLFLAGCSFSQQEAERLFQSDTVVNIPLQPEETEAPTEAPTESTEPPATEETVPEETAEAETAPEETKASTSTKKTSSGKSSGSKTSGSGSSSKKPAATEPPETQPPETAPPETLPPETVPPETEPERFDISGYSPGSMEYAVAEQINAYRTEAGLEPLSVSTKLCGIAAARAWEVSASWSHTRPDGRGWKSVLGDYGYGYGTASEQLAHTSGYDAVSVVSSWMGSSSNSAELLNPAYTTIGVGLYSVGGSVFLAAILIG